MTVKVTVEIGVKKEDFYIEIQLRTLFQDVWAGLEHELVYKKGNVNEHIKRSFKLLAKDLENNDSLIDTLKRISDKEISIEEYQSKSRGPHKYFDYEKELIADDFYTDSEIKKCFDEYKKYILDQPDIIDKTWTDKALEKYREIGKCFTSDEKENNLSIEYLLEMEKAYLHFCNGNYKDALDIYNTQKRKHEDRYVIHFRIGEINLAYGKIEEALVNFDTSENILSKKYNINLENYYRIKVNLAYTYWSLGKAFIHLSLQKINEAKELYARVDKNHLDKFSYENLANNLCYYNLEYFIKLNEELKLISVKTTKYKNTLKLRDSVLATLKNRFKSFEEIINRKKLPSNLYDTAAWYYYQMYLLEKNKSFFVSHRVHRDHREIKVLERICSVISASSSDPAMAGERARVTQALMPSGPSRHGRKV